MDIQEGQLNLAASDQINEKLGEDKLTFWDEVSVLTNIFEPFEDYYTEQAKFELNKCT